MKKLFTFLSICLIAVVLVSCGSRSDYRHLVPSDALIVMSANPKAIAAKAQIGDFTQSTMYGHIRTQLAENDDMAPETRDYILSLVAEPSKSGLSMDHDCFMFMKGENFQNGEFDMGVVFKMHDRKAMDKFAEFVVEQADLTKQEENGIAFLMDKDSWSTQIIAYNNEAAVVYVSSHGFEQTVPVIKNLFTQKKENSVMARPQVAAILNNNNDMNMVMSYASMMPMMRQMGMGTDFEWMGKMVIAAPSNFEKGAVVSDIKVMFDDKDAEKQYMEFGSVYGKMSGGMLKLLPAGSIAAFGGSIDGAKTYAMLAKIPTYSMIFAMAPQIQSIMEAINGEMMLSFNTMSEDARVPLATVMATVTDESVVATIRDLAAMGGIKMSETAPGNYQGNMQGIPFWFGFNNGMLYISTDGGFIEKMRNGSAETSLHDVYGQLFDGSYGAFALDIDAVRGMLEKMVVNNIVPQQLSMALPYIALFKDVRMNSQSLTEGKVVLNMTDREKNAAETIYRAVEGMVNMAVAGMPTEGHECCGECGGNGE